MATVVDTRQPVAPRAPSKKPSGPIPWVRDHILQIVAGLALLYMFLPIFVVVQFSFNKPLGKTNYDWHGFSTDAVDHRAARAACAARSALSLEDRRRRHDRVDDPGHPGGVRAGPLPVRRPLGRPTC